MMPCNDERIALWRIGELCGIFFCIFGAILVIRWPVTLFPLALNPDEVQAGANVLRGMAFGFNWTGMDGTTAGPLDSFVLAWPYLFGQQVTLFSVRITATVLISLSSFFVYLAARRIAGRLMAVALILPMLLFYLATGNADFLHYSSELLPIALLTASNVLVVRSLDGDAPVAAQFFWTGLLLGCVPFAKLQAAPLAVVVWLFALGAIWLFYRERRWPFTAQIILGTLVVPGLFFVPLLIAGQLKEFWISYILWGMEYVISSTTISAYLEGIRTEPNLSGASLFLVLIFVTLAALACRYKPVKQITRMDFLLPAYVFLLTGMAIFVILKPGRGFLHYAHLYVPFIVLSAAVPARFIHFTKNARVIFCVMYVTLFCTVTVTVHDVLKARGLTWGCSSPLRVPQGKYWQSSDLYRWIPADNPNMLIWGWMPQWYLVSGKVPATRESHVQGVVIPSRLREHFISRFMNDMAASKPSIVLDAVTKTAFAAHIFKDDDVHSLEPLGRMVDADYTRVRDYAETPDCARLYLANDVHRRLSDSLIVPFGVTGPRMHDDVGPDRLFDSSVTEDICKDYWLMPDNSKESVTVRLSSVEPITRVLLLNTRGGSHLDRAAKKVRLVFSRNGVEVSTIEADMQPYPNWTTVMLDPGVEADSMTLAVLDNEGLGGGLNEVKLFRR